MPGTAAITCKVTEDLRDSIHQMAKARDLSVNQFVFNILQSYVVSGKAEYLPSVSPTSVGNARSIALANLENALPSLIDTLVQAALAGDRTCAMYCIDRLMGKPKQQIDQRTLNVNATGEEFARLVQDALKLDQSTYNNLLQAPPADTTPSQQTPSDT